MRGARLRGPLALSLALLAVLAHFAPLALDRSYDAFRSPGAESRYLWVAVLIPALIFASLAVAVKAQVSWRRRLAWASIATIAVALYGLGDMTYSMGSEAPGHVPYWSAWLWAEFLSVAAANGLHPYPLQQAMGLLRGEPEHPTPLAEGLDCARPVVLAHPDHGIRFRHACQDRDSCQGCTRPAGAAVARDLYALGCRTIVGLLQRCECVCGRRGFAEIPPFHPAKLPRSFARVLTEQVDGEVGRLDVAALHEPAGAANPPAVRQLYDSELVTP